MANNVNKFHEIVKENFDQLDLYTTAITRVHGKSHPEAFDVRELFEAINKKINETNSSKPNLDKELSQLRQVTDNYNAPKDVCGTYISVYNMLSEVDKAYQAME